MKFNIKSFSSKLLIILAAMAALAFDRDDDTFQFNLSTNRIYSPGESGINVEFSGRVGKRANLELRAYRIADPVQFFLSQNNPHSPGSGSDESDKTDDLDLRDTRRFKLVADWEHQVSSRDRYWQYESIPVPLKEKGVYVIQAAARGKVANTVLVITELGMIVKQSNSQAMAYVSNRRSGERVTGVPITFAHDPKQHVEGRTGDDGVAQASITGIMKDDTRMREEWEWGGSSQLVVIGGKGDDFVISDSYFYRRYGRSGNDGSLVYLHTDRPVYRPSQTVYYRGIARSVTEDGTYQNIAFDSVFIEANDARGGLIKKDTLRLSDFGTFNGELTLGDEPPLGNYSINVTIRGMRQTFSFAVEEYKKPEYEVEVITDRRHYTRGDEIKATVKAEYYFGSPVASGEVQYQIYRARYWRPWWFRSDWAYLYEGSDESSHMYGMQMVTTGQGKLADDGTYTISFKTEGGGDEDYTYRIQANVVDASRRSIAGMTSVKVTRGELYVTANTTKYVYKPGDEVQVNVETIAFDGEKPISAPFDVRVEHYNWNKRGRDYDKSTVWKGSGATDGNGAGSVRFPLKDAGYYAVTVTARDSRGTEIATSSSIYVADNNYASWYNGNEGGVQVIPDRALYKPGETMSALVIMPAPNVDALITAEGATIYNHQVTRLNATSAIIRMPIESRHAPMFYLNASAIAEDNFYSQSQRITVAPEGKVIKIEVKTDQSIYKPGQKGKVTVRALDSRGEPVPDVDVALAVVDEAIYAIRPDETPDIQKFFYGTRWNEVATNTSLNFRFWASSRKEEFRDGLAAGSAPAKAANRSMMTEQAMDLEAAPPPPPPSPANEPLVEPALRSDFRDLMFWTPSVRTDSKGYATVDVSFPDNLTTWRITARGVNRATAVGQATANVIARKDLLVRMETPRFITQGDELVIATTVHNYLSSAKRTKVLFTAEGVALDGTETTVEIPADGEKRIDWKIKAPKIGEAKLTVKALTNEESDAMQLTVPILPQGVRSGASALADLDEHTSAKTISLVMPSNSEPASGEMTIALAPSAASSVLGALDELIGYPYGCVEQTMSRFLPTVVVADALKKIDVPFDPKKREELPKMVEKGLNRLYGLQHEDGGWGWWEHDETNPFMTAYVMYGMTVAKRAGHDIDERRYERGLQSLRSLIESRRSGGGLGSGDKRLEGTTEAYMLYVASFITMGPDRLYGDRTSALARRSDINNYGLALLALAAHYQKDRALADRLASQLVENAEVTASSARWSGKSWHYNWQDDQVETSAFAVKALLETKGETELVRKGIHYLLAQKQGTAWENTRQTAMVIYALIDYIKSSKELDPNYQLTVRVNGREVYSKRMTKADIFAPEQQVKVDRSLLHQGSNDIAIEKNGGGKLYATARLVYYATGPAIKSSDAGFKVTREYHLLKRVLRKGAYVYEKTKYNGSVKSGDELLVKVKIVPSSRYEYFMLEDPLPAGCEVVTKTEGYTIPGENGYGGRDDYYYDYYRWNWWYADRDVRDEKVAFFAREMSPQAYEFSYIMRAQIPGSYSVMPSVGALMYYPEVRGNSDAIAMTITDAK